MKICFLNPDVQSYAVDGVVRNLSTWSPFDIVNPAKWKAADVVVVPVIGRREHTTRLVSQAKSAGKKVVLHQYVLRSSMSPKLLDWFEIWQQCEFIFTYYPLKAWSLEEGVSLPCYVLESPLGVDGTFRYVSFSDFRSIDLLTTGRGWLTESVRECVLAARAARRTVEHLGTGLNDSRSVTQHSGLTQIEVVNLMRRCLSVSGLRRIEGFELPAAEGACVGARPILFDRLHYRRWYEDCGAVFIKEQPRSGVLAELTDVIKNLTPLSVAEIAAARRRFDWFAIAQTYWKQFSEI